MPIYLLHGLLPLALYTVQHNKLWGDIPRNMFYPGIGALALPLFIQLASLNCGVSVLVW
jgi:hypothetical protein